MTEQFLVVRWPEWPPKREELLCGSMSDGSSPHERPIGPPYGGCQPDEDICNRCGRAVLREELEQGGGACILRDVDGACSGAWRDDYYQKQAEGFEAREFARLCSAQLVAAGVATWLEVTERIAATLPAEVIERPAPWFKGKKLERVAFDEMANYSARFVTRCDGEASWFNPHPLVEFTRDPFLFSTEPSEDALDVTDILNVAWIVLLSKCGALRGVVDPACFDGVR